MSAQAKQKKLAFCDLPFVQGSGKKRTNWCAPRKGEDDYRAACNIGAAWAAHFIKYLQDNPGTAVGDLGHIAADINFADESDRKGYWVGFFSILEKYLVRGAEGIDPYEALMAMRAGWAREAAEMDLSWGMPKGPKGAGK